MSNRKKLSVVEWEIMEAIWHLGGAPSVREVLEYAYPDRRKAYTTVQTIMNNMENKGLLTRQKIGLVNFYTPVWSREEMVKEETGRLVSRVFNGSFPALVNHLINSDDLSLAEIEKIKALIEEKEALLKRGNS